MRGKMEFFNYGTRLRQNDRKRGIIEKMTISRVVEGGGVLNSSTITEAFSYCPKGCFFL